MIKGIQFAGIASGIKPSGLDLGLVFFEEEVNVLSLYTKNRVKAAHILYNRKIERGPVRALLVNSGCANACTGKEGIEDLYIISRELSSLLGIGEGKILFASTGVIGKRLPVSTIVKALPILVKDLKGSHFDHFAQAIMTTDTFKKTVDDTFQGKKRYRIMAAAKGAGMINPLFATMLSFIFTDYSISPKNMERPFTLLGKETFERISVDGECSTNDSVMLFTKRDEEDIEALPLFKERLLSAMKELSLMIVRDGEGATKTIHIKVEGAKKKGYAERIARRIAVSPLTKTAFFGCDPNWGRIIAAAGDAGVPLQPGKVDISLQGEVIVKGGVEVPFDEQAMKRKMNKREVEVVVNLNDGKASFDIYTSDLTFDYVKINASYRS
ncbi:MAG: bifunctional glutamate N-acetyltransferase/amino-acid acetyltransferase ArgJ [Syntrophorhabdaceae bacterium]|nr:bifunctional glutamate N-acetyltransferase/amino-acid acetyltransferase ArgJ [Syntrophorhabdaceae bacterium]